MNQPFVTIAIPTYNRANVYLKHALLSAASQTYQNLEIIVSNNCSEDNTEEIVKSFSDPRIRYFRQSANIGMTKNLMFCLEQAKGDYFLLLNDDDMIDDDFVDVCMKAANYSADIGVILTGARVIDEDGKFLYKSTNKANGLSTTDFFLAWFDHKVPFYDCTTLYNTKRLRDNGGFCSKKGLYDDNVALVVLAARFGRVDVRDVKASFRRHGNNFGTTFAKIADWCEDSLYLLDVMCSLVPEAKDKVRHRGMVYFSIENYVRCTRIESLAKRAHAYLIVYKRFKYCYSPLHFINIRAILRKKVRTFIKK
jgi:glycosyltransferase involved in cell wall biosynthesis